MRGCGLSDRDVTDFSFEALVRDLETIVDAARLERFDLFAMSQGGSVAIAYAARHPERINKLIIYGGFLEGWLQPNPTPEESEAAEFELKLLKLSWGSENPAYRQVFTMKLIPEATPEQFTWYNNLQLVSTSPANALKLQRTFNKVDVRELAAMLNVPTLVLQAKEDAAVAFEDGRRTAAQIPNARFVTLDSKNHVLLATEPAWPEFWEAFYRFLGITDEKRGNGEGSAVGSDQEALFLELTRREVEVLRGMVHGNQNNEIARQLTVSPKTVRNYVSNIYSKLQVSGRREAIAVALRRGINVDHEHP